MSDLAILKDKMQKVLAGEFNGIRVSGEDSFTVPFEYFGVDLEASVHEDPKVRKWRQDNGLPITSVSARAFVLRGITESPEFYRFMAREVAMATKVQAFVGDDSNEEGKLFVGTYYRIGADTMDPNELIYAVMSVYWDSMKIGEMVTEAFDGKWQWASEE
jgi:hypothetical protein